MWQTGRNLAPLGTVQLATYDFMNTQNYLCYKQDYLQNAEGLSHSRPLVYYG
jgi:hypothetical protein